MQRKKRLFLMNRDRYSGNVFYGKHGMPLKLIKKDDGDTITVYYKDKPIGMLSSNFDSDFEKQFSDTSRLKYLPENSQAKYYLKYGRFEILEIEDSVFKKEKARLKYEHYKLIKRYPKKELITISPGREDIEFNQAMKFKLIKESDSDYIGVYLDNDKIGFVAKNLACNLTSKASDIKIPDGCYAEYLCKYEDKYHVARIIN